MSSTAPTPTGVLIIHNVCPRRVWRDPNLGGTGDPNEVVAPLVVVGGRAAAFAGDHASLTVPAGPTLVEAMDDHRYTSRTVDVPADGTADLSVGVGPHRHDNRIVLGPADYAARAAVVPAAPAIKAALACFGIAAVVISLLGPLLYLLAPPLGGLAVPLGAVAAIAPYRGLRRRFQPAPPPPPPEPEVLDTVPGTGRPARVLGPFQPLPDDGPAIVLRFGPEPHALDQIAVGVRSTTGGAVRPFMSNSFDDWLAAPRVRLDGQTLPARWGALWLPVRPGRSRLEVHLPGFADPRRGLVTGPGANAALDVEVEGVVHLDCHYNVVRLAAERRSHEPGAESRWQRVLRGQHRLEQAERAADAPSLTIEAARPGPIR